jgi:hypothetical protein
MYSVRKWCKNVRDKLLSKFDALQDCPREILVSVEVNSVPKNWLRTAQHLLNCTFLVLSKMVHP